MLYVRAWAAVVFSVGMQNLTCADGAVHVGLEKVFLFLLPLRELGLGAFGGASITTLL